MNKKGFTLVELLAVIALVAILSGIAVANVVSSINNSRKNTFLLDAKRMISKAEYLLAKNRNQRNIIQTTGSYLYTFSDLNEKDEFSKDADGLPYDEDKTFVNITLKNGKYHYCICVIGSKKKITGSSQTCSKENTTEGIGCLLSDELTGIDKVID